MDYELLVEIYRRFNNFSVPGRREVYKHLLKGDALFYSSYDPHTHEQILMLECFDYFDEVLEWKIIWNYQ